MKLVIEFTRPARNIWAAVILSVAIWLSLAPPASAQSLFAEVPGLGAPGLDLAPSVPSTPPLNVVSPLTFNFTLGPGIIALQGSNPTLAANVVTGFNTAADLWRAAFVDPITINVTIDFQSLGAGILGSTSSQTVGATYSNTRTALIGDLTSANDTIATSNLPNVAARTFFTNNRGGTLFLDADGSANNSVLDIPRANAKAIGLVAGNNSASDGSVTFSSNFNFDFNRGDGVSGGQFDFVGVAAHEIGHLMGFVSGVDVVDFYTGAGPNAGVDLNGGTAGIGTLDPFRVFNILDLYRYNAKSVSQGVGVLGLATGDTPFFSINGGATNLATFSTGVSNGDGRQASHWKDSLTLGIMDPTLAPGELATISLLDLLAFDVIGFDVSPVPEPSSIFAGLAMVGFAGWRERRLSQARRGAERAAAR